MNYRIEIQPRAVQEIDEEYRWIWERSRINAQRWRERLDRKLETLTRNPKRCPLADESDAWGVEVREILFGRRGGIYRVLFTVTDETVQILRFRHAARASDNK